MASQPTPPVDTAAFLIVGNELLSGKVQEANLFELARTLRALGVRLARVVVLPDEVELIAREIRELSARFDLLFTSGGVGPTHDDVTIAAAARAFDVQVERDPTLASLIQNAYGARCTDAHLDMARVPQGTLLRGAPDVEWPIPVLHNVWILPGVPEVFRAKLDAVRAWVRGPLPFFTRAAFTRLDEPALKPLLDRLVERHPLVEIGSYPKWFEPSYRTKLTFDGRQSASVEAALADLLSELAPADVVRVE